MAESLKKIENRVYETTQKTLKLEKQIKNNYLKSKEKENQTLEPIVEDETDPIQ